MIHAEIHCHNMHIRIFAELAGLANTQHRSMDGVECEVEALDLSDFESTNNYFECPLLPRRGRG